MYNIWIAIIQDKGKLVSLTFQVYEVIFNAKN